MPGISELKTKATDVTERTESPSWDYDVSGCNLFSVSTIPLVWIVYRSGALMCVQILGMKCQEDILFMEPQLLFCLFSVVIHFRSLYLISCYDFESQENEGSWKWKKPPPASKKRVSVNCSQDRREERKAVRKGQNNSLKEMVLKGSHAHLNVLLSCLIFQF